ncbi:uncharacterized protein At1g76070 [Manihot esculenta]|uniref:Syringolide-induced protein 14-1-1 n=1 Tax=Manihot esculenta TaxID=3983 RepID=A0A2C9VXL1_MANES|nr:uncharacterized protein At1g76070 [Manihot esculenta]OAY50518.1 hypothetical protein MANES_05G142500v8 [Manihot esculenta]
MEKQPKSKNKILKFLPKAASAVYFQNPPFSPSRDKRSENHFHRHRVHAGKGFSSPVVSIIPDEIRRKPKNGSFDSQEPNSPKVSCMGQIKCKKKIVNKAKHSSSPHEAKTVPSSREIKKHESTIMKFSGSARPIDERRRSDSSIYDKQPLSDRAPPSLSQMRHFASSRDAFANFDWTAQIAPVDSEHGDSYADEEGRVHMDIEEEEVIVPFSAPTTVGPSVALQPRRDVNLWKRRIMSPPRRLQLNLIV